MTFKNKETIAHLLSRNIEGIIDRNHLEAAIVSGKKLRVKLGIDPTGEKIHIGRAIALWKLKEFQDLGHQVVLIIGDFTAQIGDPSDKLGKRPFLTEAQIASNMKNYLAQIGMILDMKKTEVRRNSEWLSKLSFKDVVQLMDLFTAQQMLERRNFSERWKDHKEIFLSEFSYALMQGYDSVAIKADVELGGTDQLFNLMAGRKIQERYGQKPQDVVTLRMLIGTDGRKMSTSWGNVINISDPADEQFGKLMAMHDEVMSDYFRMATDFELKEVAAREKELKRGKNPKEVKLELAEAIVARYHGAKDAKAAKEKWQRVFSKKEVGADDIPELTLPSGTLTAAELVLASKAVKSKSEAWRLVSQGGLKVNDKSVSNPRDELRFSGGEIIRIGKKSIFRIKK